MDHDGLVQVQNDVEQLITDAKKLMSDVGSVSEKEAAELKVAGVALLDKALERINTSKSQIKQSGEQFLYKAKCGTHEHPIRSLGIAALIGGLVGAILFRK